MTPSTRGRRAWHRQPESGDRRLSPGALSSPHAQERLLRDAFLHILQERLPNALHALFADLDLLPDNQRAVHERVRRWAQTHNVATLAWIEEWAKGAVRREITRRKIEEQLRQRFPEMASHKNAWKTSLFEPLFVEEAEGDSFQAISPQPLIEDREQFMKRAGDAWAAEEARLEQSGYTPTRLITREHVDWFIEYQIKGRSYGDIAKNVGRDRKAVEMAVKDIARKLGCSLREPNSSGRPRKDAAKN